MPSAALLKKLASLLLVLCFVLPLSKCTAKKPVDASKPAVEQIIYGYDYIALAADSVRVDDLLLIAGVLVTFFAPAAALAIREPRRSIVQVAAAFPSLYLLRYLAFIGTPQYGAILAIACWLLLLVLGAVTLWRTWRPRREGADSHGESATGKG